MDIHKGHTVLDVGCGPGFDTVSLAKIVGSSGKVVGVDYDIEMIAQADKNAETTGVIEWCEHKLANATQLPFESDTFDSCRSESLFQHLLQPEKSRPAYSLRASARKSFRVFPTTLSYHFDAYPSIP